MKAIIVGAGDVGLNIANHLATEGQDVVIIDLDETKLQQINETVDIQTVCGSGSYPDVLAKAGCEHADMLIAVTDSDEINMVTCQMGHSLFDVKIKIARVENRSYLGSTKNKVYTPENLPIDMIISPELEISDTILRTMAVPGSFDTYLFADDNIILVGMNVASDVSIIDVQFRALQNKLELPFRVVAIFRDGRLIIPQGSDHLEAGDELYFICHSSKIEESISHLGLEIKPIKDVFVIGGSGIGYNLCQRLEKMNISTRVLEYNKERANFLAENLQKTTVLHGDALDHELLIQENIGQMDAVLAVTSSDSKNMLASISADQLGAKSVITIINGADFIRLSDMLKLDIVISPRYVTASKVIHFTRSGDVVNLHTIHEDKAEISEITLSNESPLIGMNMLDLKLPEGILIPAIYSKDRGIIFSGENSTIHAGDRIIILYSTENINDIAKLV